VRDLLEALLASSANDAAVALAEAVAGSETSFARLMNRKARDLGVRHSNFTNASGLPDKRQVTTPYDLFLITRAAFNNSFIKDVMEQKSICVLSQDGDEVVCRNHNKLLWRLDDPKVLGKTGYTQAAHHCYAGIAYYDDHKVAIVILKSRKPWDDIAKILKVRLNPK
jgi:D-alanyl-D-alanine carboxypeptidase